MIKIAEKTLIDLEFNTICKQISEFCITHMGVEKALEIVPYTSSEKAVFGLQETNEYPNSYQQESRIPNHGLGSFHQDRKMVPSEDSLLETWSVKKISVISETANTQLRFFNEKKELYPTLNDTTSDVKYTKDITET